MKLNEFYAGPPDDGDEDPFGGSDDHSNKRLSQLLSYYIDGWSGFSNRPDGYTNRVMQAIQYLHQRGNLDNLTPQEDDMANTVLNYGAEVDDSDLRHY